MVPSFPPKKIFTLTPAEVEQRREHLEKYMQAGELLTLTFLKKEKKNLMTHRLPFSVPGDGRSFVPPLVESPERCHGRRHAALMFAYVHAPASGAEGSVV